MVLELKSNRWLKKFRLAVPAGRYLRVVVYAIVNGPSLGTVEKTADDTTNAILIIMLSVAALTTILCKSGNGAILNSSTFKAGMSACICILGVAWLGDTFVSLNIDWIKDTAVASSRGHPWLLAVIFFFNFRAACSTLRRQRRKRADADGAGMNVSPLTAVASFAAVSGLRPFLPTYPTLVAAVRMDDTGTTRIGDSSLTTRSSSRHHGEKWFMAVCFGTITNGFYAVKRCFTAGRITPAFSTALTFILPSSVGLSDRSLAGLFVLSVFYA